MIAVVGNPAWSDVEPPGPAGRACEIALAAATAGARVELVGRAGSDAAGDRILLGLARAGVGHAAILRDAAHGTPIVARAGDGDDDPFADPRDDAPAGVGGPRLDPADVALGLRYLTAFEVVVVVDDLPGDVLHAAAEAADFAGARLLAILPPGGPSPDAIPGLPSDAVVLAAPGPDDGAFGALVGRLAARLDQGIAPDEALRDATDEGGWVAVALEEA